MLQLSRQALSELCRLEAVLEPRLAEFVAAGRALWRIFGLFAGAGQEARFRRYLDARWPEVRDTATGRLFHLVLPDEPDPTDPDPESETA